MEVDGDNNEEISQVLGRRDVVDGGGGTVRSGEVDGQCNIGDGGQLGLGVGLRKKYEVDRRFFGSKSKFGLLTK